MSRQSKPWYFKQVGCYYAWIEGRRVKLLRVAKSKKNFAKARQVLSDLLYESRHNILQVPSEQTVSSVIAAYVAEVAPKLAKSTMAVRGSYLESFDECCDSERIDICMPDLMQDWLDGHPGWSDWTKNGAVRNVHRQEAVIGQNRRRRQHAVGSQRGHEDHRAARHRRRLAAIRDALDARRRRHRQGPRADRRRSPTLRSKAEEQAGFERRMGVAQQSREPHRANEGRSHTPGLQGPSTWSI
jgi:hypothetical protein